MKLTFRWAQASNIDPNLGSNLNSGSDLENISRLVNSAYRGDDSRHGWTTEADLLDGQRTDVTSLKQWLQQGGEILLLEEDHQLLGCLQCQAHLDEKYYYIGMITIDPRQQNRGLGKKIIQYMESVAQQKNLRELRLTVIPVRQELVSWYQRLDFQFSGQVFAFPYGDEKFGKPRRSDLTLAEMKKSLASPGDKDDTEA